MVPILSFTIYSADLPCDILQNPNATSTNLFHIDVSPKTLQNNVTYTVTVNGTGNVTVVLQALSNSSVVGNWLEVSGNCSGNPLFENPLASTRNLVVNWTSPSDVISQVIITAYITNHSAIFNISQTLEAGKLSARIAIQPVFYWQVAPLSTTTAPAAGNTTTALNGSNTTAAPATGNTTTSTETTNTGSAALPSSMSMALIQIFGLFLITGRLLL
ncbi:uncharacterized protein RCH25_007902 [Pelodytes ibericus]